MNARTPRDRRRAGVEVVLGPRDEALLRSLARFRLARTDDLVRLFFSQTRRDTAAARLRKLFDAGFLQTRSEGLNELNLYALGPRGVSWAETCGLPGRRPPQGSIDHHVAIVGCWSVLAAALAIHPHLRLGRFEPDWELRSRLAGQAVPVAPDAVVEIAERSRGQIIQRFALEIDLGTERPGELRRKLTRYDLSSIFPGVPTAVLVVLLKGAGARRLAEVKSLVTELWVGESVVCSESDWPQIVIGASDKAPLTPTPCGDGRDVDGSPSESQISVEQGEGHSR